MCGVGIARTVAVHALQLWQNLAWWCWEEPLSWFQEVAHMYVLLVPIFVGKESGNWGGGENRRGMRHEELRT